MKSTKFAPMALFVTWVGLLVAYWPSGCVQSLAGSRAGASTSASEAPAMPDSVQPVPEQPGQGLPRGFLPHPAFAYAQESRDAAGKPVTIADIAERATPSVVNVASRRMVQERGPQDPFFRFFFGPDGMPEERQQQGLGSGVVYSKDGLVLTNNHVVEGADEITVTTGDGVDYEAVVVGTDDKSDVAVLRLKGDVKNLVPITVGDSSQLRVGDVVLAIGNPFGFSQTVTMGIVSAKGRSETGIVDYADFIQTDAAINPGNSGGALVNMQGELVGINTAIVSRTGGYQGIGFAIPSNMAQKIAQSLVTDGRVVRGWLGIGIQDVDADLAAAMTLPNADGVLVSDVEPNSPADKAGVQRGDVVLSVDGRKTNSSAQLRNLIAEAGANKKVQLAIFRTGKLLNVDVLLGELKSDKPAAESQKGDQKEESLDGLSLEPLDQRLRQRLQLPPTLRQGVVVTGIAPGSRAAESGLRPGDVIVEANRRPVGNLQQFGSAYKQAGKKLLLLVYRNGRTHYVVLTR